MSWRVILIVRAVRIRRCTRRTASTRKTTAGEQKERGISDTHPTASGPAESDELRPRGDFIPNLCSVHGVFGLVLVGELLSLALVLADNGLADFQWQQLGLVSLLVEWVALFSAACLCPLRPWFRRQSSVTAGCISYSVVLLVTLAFSALGQLSQYRELDLLELLNNLLIAAVFAGVALRYFYIQQQLHNQQQAELQARVQALQSRIRPHFLFNSMNSIASLIAVDPHLAERMVEDLSGLFRASLQEPGLIPLQRELDLCHRFVRIEQLRLGDRLRVRWLLPDAVPESVQVPSLLLQPLVENAIYHGVQPRPEGGEVVIGLTLADDRCCISVSNPVPPDDHRSTGSGVALANIRHRLQAYYGTLAEMLIESEQGRFTVLVNFPARPPH